MRETMTRREWMVLLAAAAAVAILLGLVGRYAPWISPDTASYLSVPPLPEGWGEPRHPLFGWMAALVPGGVEALPLVQTLAFLAATLFLHHALRICRLSERGAGSVTAALLGSNLLLLWHAAIHPEFPAVSLMLAALAFAIRCAAGRPFAANAFLFALCLGLAYVLRPSFLPAIFLLPLLYALLARMRGEVRIGRRAGALMLLAALPFLANSTIRWRAVGDFNIVSFGGYQMSGMAGLMLTPQIVAALPEDMRPLGQSILDIRTAAEAKGEVIATPENSRGERSFVSTALGYYDLYARTYDDLLQTRIGSLRGNESWVAFNAKLMKLSVATIRLAPDRYAAWLVGGTMRLVGRALAGNLAFVLASGAFVLLYLAAIWGRRLPEARASAEPDVPALLCLTLATAASAGALTVVTTFPAARYIDTVGLFIPALPLYGCATCLSALRRRAA